MISFNTFCYNVGFAKRFGVICAVLVNYIDNEYSVAYTTGALKSDGRMLVDRKEISYRTGALVDEIVKAEEVLTKLGVLDVLPCKNSAEGKMYYIYRRDTLIQGIDRAESVNPVENILQSVQSTDKRHTVPKRVKEMTSLKSMVQETDESIKQYWCDWIDSVYGRGFNMTPVALNISVDELRGKSNEAKEAILRIAIRKGCKDIAYAISEYDKSCGTDRNWKSYADMQATDNTVISTSEGY